MKKPLLSLRTAALLGAMAAAACVFAITASADSTITVPVPNGASGRQFTLSLRIPPDTEPIMQEKKQPAPGSKRNVQLWNAIPLPELEKNDEALEVLRRFKNKGWVKNRTHQNIISAQTVSKTHVVSVLQAVCRDVIEIAMAPNFSKIAGKVNVNPTDIEDLRRMVSRFQGELIKFGSNPASFDKDLLTLQEYLTKSNKTGILKVIRVEDQNDGSTVIHLKVN